MQDNAQLNFFSGTNMTQFSANSDPNELNNFNQLAHTWWDEGGEFSALHKINPLRLDFILQHHPLDNQQVLDIGCGGGILTESLAKSGAQAKGIDLAEEVLTVAKLHALETQTPVNYELISAEDQAKQAPETYDIVTCMEMLEHVPDPQSIIQAAADLVKPNGWVFFSTLNRNLKAYLLAVFAAEQVFNLVPKGTHQHDKFITPAELSAMARQAGLTLRSASGIEFNPLLNHYRLNKDLSINYLLAFQKL